MGIVMKCLSKNHEKLMKIIKDTCQQNNIIFEVKEVFNYMKVFEEENNEVQIGFDI